MQQFLFGLSKIILLCRKTETGTVWCLLEVLSTGYRSSYLHTPTNPKKFLQFK